jgi:hypothetical protein
LLYHLHFRILPLLPCLPSPPLLNGHQALEVLKIEKFSEGAREKYSSTREGARIREQEKEKEKDKKEMKVNSGKFGDQEKNEEGEYIKLKNKEFQKMNILFPSCWFPKLATKSK